jgi:hypothetical protein
LQSNLVRCKGSSHIRSPPFFFIFGLTFSQFGYAYLKRGSFQYTPERGPAQIISPATNAPVYWMVTAGLLAVGALFVAIAVCRCLPVSSASHQKHLTNQ